LLRLDPDSVVTNTSSNCIKALDAPASNAERQLLGSASRVRKADSADLASRSMQLGSHMMLHQFPPMPLFVVDTHGQHQTPFERELGAHTNQEFFGLRECLAFPD
jgi:hypothetical protein